MIDERDSLTIRAADPDDAPAVAALLSEFEFPAPAAVVAGRLEALSAAGEMVLVAVRGSNVVGFVTLHITPVLHRPAAVGRLTALIVTERERATGVGRLLVDAGEKFLVTRGCEIIEVTSNRRLEGAHAFYKRLGYEATSFRFQKSLAMSLPRHS